MPEDILAEIRKEHLPYEIGMLRGTFERLREIDASGGVAENDIAKQVCRNALIESFCVHARSLLDFFANRPDRRADDAVAQDFVAFASSLKPTEEPLKSLREKLNKEIFHLTKKRKITGKFDVSTDGVKLLEMIEAERKRFTAALPPEFPLLECKIAPLQVASLRFQTQTAVATNYITFVKT
jgi:hypothetical protein